MNKFFGKGVAALFAMILFFALSSELKACEIDFEILKGEKATYSVGDEIVVKVIVFLTHRNCPEGINKTKFKTKGVKVIGKTKWDEKSPGTFERKLKLKITGDKSGKMSLNAIRTCDKEGGFGSITFRAE